MKKTSLLTVLLVCCAMSGCSATAGGTRTPVAVASSPPSSVATATATPSATPSTMSVSDASSYYLAAICKSNLAGDDLDNAATAQPFNLTLALQKAAALRDDWHEAIVQLSTPPAHWPDSAAADVTGFTDALYGELSTATILAASPSQQAFIATYNAWGDPSAPQPAHVASQKVRVKLGLSSDAMATCKTS